MKNRIHPMEKNREHHPRVGVGLFLIVLGLALLVATNDLLGLGSVQEYYLGNSAGVHWCFAATKSSVHGRTGSDRRWDLVFH